MPEDGAPAAQLDLALRADRVRLPRDLWPMLAVDGEAPFDSLDHLFDAWWGGTRVLAFVEGGGAILVDEHGADVSDRYPAVVASLSALGDAAIVLDGEIVESPGAPSVPPAPSAGAMPLPGAAPSLPNGPTALPGPPSPHGWATPVPGEPPPLVVGPAALPGGAVALVAQDLLVLEGRSLLAEPLQRRRVALATAVPPRDALVVAEPVPCDGIELLAAAAALGLPGIVAKRRDSPYLPGVRSALWLRIAASAFPARRAGGLDDRAGTPADSRAARFAPAPLRRALVLLRGLPFEEP